MKNIDLSKVILETIKNHNKTNKNIVIILSELLHLSKDAIYRRLSGKVDLSLKETVELCKYYNLSIDNIILSNQKISFDYFALFNEYFSYSYRIYLSALESSLQVVINENGNIYVSAADIPIGFLLRYPLLMAFKLYCWRNDMVDPNQHIPFTLKTQQNPYGHFFDRFPKLYEQANSSELWCQYTFSGYIEAILFYKELDLIPSQIVEMLNNDLHCLLKDAERFAADGKKEAGGRFMLYLTPLTMANSIFLVESNNKMSSFLKLYAINSIWTSNTLYCNEQKKWFEAMINSSTIISGSCLKERKKFFDNMHKLVENI